MKHLDKSYDSKFSPVRALDNISFTVEGGEFVEIMGPSGTGETTLMSALFAISLPAMGSVLIQGKEITKVKNSELNDFRWKRLGSIFQEFSLTDTLNAKDNVLLPLAAERIAKEEMEKGVGHVTRLSNVEELFKQYPDELSVKQRQRTAAARALVVQPQAIFADEPTGSLDSKPVTELSNYLRTMDQKEEVTILLVACDPYIANCCDKILFIEDGVVSSEAVRKGARRELFEKVMGM